ncbi:MAG: DsbC family protein [Nitrospirae bacterium]|nr:DsbC family protein [Nitrospirota bacterium]
MSNDEASKILKGAVPDIKVLEIKNSPIKGVWEITAETKGKNSLYYIDFSKKLVIAGSIFNIETKVNLTQERYLEINKVDVSQIPLDDAIIVGDKKAEHRIIIFTDTNCPYCAKLHEETKKIIEKRKDIAFYVKMFPLNQSSIEKAKAIVCEKSLKLLDDAFAKKQLPEPKCKTSAIDENLKLGRKIGINGTPTLILPNGSLIPGYKDADSLISLIDKSS